MPIINLSDPVNILIAVVLYVLILFLSKEVKKSSFTCVMLLTFLALIAAHCIEYVVPANIPEEIRQTLANCIAVDFVFAFLSFIGYLWMDDVEAKDKKIKSIDDSLNWFWKKV